MIHASARAGILITGLLLILLACNLPSAATPTTVNLQETFVSGTLSALGTQAAASAPVAESSATSAIPASETRTPLPAATPQNPLVAKAALCWQGPGPVYEVVSAVKQGERVVLLGRGSTNGWWVIDNPIYHDPCWVMADVLQFDTGYNLSGLKVFNPPPTPTPTRTNTPVPTKTPTATP